MTNFSASDSSLSGIAGVVLRYDLYGDAEAALKRNSASIGDLVFEAFLQLADIGNSFNIFYHHFEMEFPAETLHFVAASPGYTHGRELYLAISLVDGPIAVPRDHRTEWLFDAADMDDLSHQEDLKAVAALWKSPD